MHIAREERVDDQLPSALRRVVIASIGPVCSEKLNSLGFSVDVEPAHPQMGQLVRAVARQGPEQVANKCREGP